MKKILFLACILKCGFLFSQSLSITPPENYSQEPFGAVATGIDKKEILAVIDQFMLAVNTKDKSIFDAILYKGINRIVTNIEKDGSGSSVVIDNDQSISLRMNPKTSEQFRERYWDAKVLTDGFIASVWAPYDFYLNGSFSHCGVDLFYLVKTDKVWKIAHFGYTRNKNCN
jgi:hypothetical protein|tara:strand:- start:1334 stop:1846 length:513 start_codon:yes stop_codon:yes gene_type:complete